MATPEPQFDEIYRDLILDHYRKPRNRGEIADAMYRAEGINPTCGDEITLDFDVEADAIGRVAFGGMGCSISQASASLMTEQIGGKSVAEVRRIMDRFEAMLVDGVEPDPIIGDLEALEGVGRFPVRVKCAMLAWKVLSNGLDKHEEAVRGADR